MKILPNPFCHLRVSRFRGSTSKKADSFLLICPQSLYLFLSDESTKGLASKLKRITERKYLTTIKDREYSSKDPSKGNLSPVPFRPTIFQLLQGR